MKNRNLFRQTKTNTTYELLDERENNFIQNEEIVYNVIEGANYEN